MIVSAGAWTKSLLPDFDLPLQATRQVLLWVQPRQPDLFRAGWFPVFMIESDDGIHYGFPLHADDGLKVAKHHHAGEIVDPDSYDRAVSSADEASIIGPIHRFLPASAGPIMSAKTCLYTMAPDEDFVIDRLPGYERIIVASPCSGHGFKFAPAIGLTLAELALTGRLLSISTGFVSIVSPPNSLMSDAALPLSAKSLTSLRQDLVLRSEPCR